VAEAKPQKPGVVFIRPIVRQPKVSEALRLLPSPREDRIDDVRRQRN
jgi:hypothetical protein